MFSLKRSASCLVAAASVLVASCVMPRTGSTAESSREEFAAATRATPDPVRGEELFRDCAACHGKSGNGTEDGSAPRIAGQHFRVLVKQLVDYRHEKRWDVRMEHHAGRGLLKDAQSIADVAAYASKLGREMPRNVGDGTLVEHGSLLYARLCAECHGAAGEGDNRTLTPRLAGQHYEYLLRQMYDAVDGRRPNFSSTHVKLLSRLERDDLVGVADFLSRSQWSPPPQPLAWN
jgi:cytochrome c553